MTKHKHEDSTDLLIGRNPVIETLQSDRDIHKLFIQEGLSGTRVNEIERLAHKRKADIR